MGLPSLRERIVPCSIRFLDGSDFRTREALTSLDRQALPTKIIDYRSGPEPMAIEEAIGHKIHAPTSVRTLDGRPRRPSVARDMAARMLPTQV